MIESIKTDFDLAWQGKEIWEKLVEKYNVDNEWLIAMLIPGYDSVNNLLLQKMPQFLKRKYIDCVLLIAVDECQISDISGKGIEQEQITEKEMEMLLKYYRLVQFSKNIVVTAIEEPFGNWGIIGKANISLEDYVENALLV